MTSRDAMSPMDAKLARCFYSWLVASQFGQPRPTGFTVELRFDELAAETESFTQQSSHANLVPKRSSAKVHQGASQPLWPDVQPDV